MTASHLPPFEGGSFTEQERLAALGQIRLPAEFRDHWATLNGEKWVKIFWSWQSDTPGKIGRFFIRDALKDAIDHLKQSPDVEEPTARESRDAMHLDQDVQNIPGSPDLARAIFNKIDVSSVVIADVTTTGKMPADAGQNGSIIPGKKPINSNVAIELGYALKALTDQRVLMVFNAHYGDHEDLPFDLRHKGGSIVFNLPPDADATRIKAERAQLKMRFVDALRPYLQIPPMAQGHSPETPTTFSRAAYFEYGGTLARVGTPGVDEIHYVYGADTSLCYLRLIPVTKLSRQIPLSDLNSYAQRAPILKREHTALGCTNRYGAIGYVPGELLPNNVNKLKASTQLFQNGEIWTVSASLIITERADHPSCIRLPLLPCSSFESQYIQTLPALIKFAENSLGLKSPWQVEFGLVGISGLHLGLENYKQLGPIHKEEIIWRERLNDNNPNSINDALLNFFMEVFDASGHNRPANLNGFPPAR